MPKLKQYTRSYYDWHELMKVVKLKSGKDPDDWAGRNTNAPTAKDYETGNYPQAKWCIEQGLDWTVLKDPVDEAGMKERVRINLAWRDSPDKPPEIPYQRFWNYAFDSIFCGDVANGSFHYFDPSDALSGVEGDEDQEWVKEILTCMIELFHENDMPDEIQVEISW